ncbi:MAG: FliA/WhiG family RNA polymerase sigma factor [Planctomycetota bacterium]|nr:FliA/WhiG family RNA polymerase sigma factor [Planctomycetota bacterium]
MTPTKKQSSPSATSTKTRTKTKRAAPAKTAVTKTKTAAAEAVTTKPPAKTTTRRSRSKLANKSPENLTLAERKRLEQEKIDVIWKMFKRTGDENLRNVLVEYHFPLVRYIAERLLQTLPKSIELDDLVSAGTFGLLDAIKGFDLKRGIKFKTYCSTRIRGSILDELRSQDWVPRLVRLKAHRLERAIQKLEATHGREANDYELSCEMEISMQELSELKVEASPKAMFSLSEKLDDTNDDRDMEKVEILEDKKGCDPVQTLHQQDVLDVITSNLTTKERLIIIMYYYEGLTMREIGDIMSLTESRVCQIHSNIMGRLKTQLK